MTDSDDARRPGSSAVALDRVVAVLGGFPVLAEASLDVAVGEIVLLPPNGRRSGRGSGCSGTATVSTPT